MTVAQFLGPFERLPCSHKRYSREDTVSFFLFFFPLLDYQVEVFPISSTLDAAPTRFPFCVVPHLITPRWKQRLQL